MTKTKRLKLARIDAQELYKLRQRGDHARADQLDRDIDELVGYWRTDPRIATGLRFCWPAEITRIARGVNA